MVDTSAFYFKEEKEINTELNKRHIERTTLKKENKKIANRVKTRHQKKGDEQEFEKNQNRINELTSEINLLKKELLSVLDENINKTRDLDQEYLKPRNVVGMFSSNTTRTIGMEEDKLSMDMIIMQVYFFPVLENTIKNGFTYTDIETGEVIKYICYTASAGQIRQKKLVFIREDLYKQHEKTLMCGLTIDKINEKGGCNTNKFMAYTALNNSATDIWEKFDIKKAIVVDDMEFEVNGLVDFIDYQTFEITRKNMDVPIPHTDGVGMMLYKKYKKAHMVRLPFIKGLLVPFPFDEFITEQRHIQNDNTIGIVKDIYGVKHDILAEGIEVIFTKSQFKMQKYYSNFAEYQQNFEMYNCQACICNEEEDNIKDSTLSYQMLQTLTDITDEELTDLCKFTKQDIINISTDRDVMLSVLGATKSNFRKNPYQKSLYLYPELLKDVYSKEVLKNKKRKLLRESYAGKLNIGGKYTFVVPDLYAFCEYLFLGIERSIGLLKNGEVSCNLFKNGVELDCLRSPHLYREHAIRENVLNDSTKKWFVSNSVYASLYDLISRILQYDSDGDKLLLTDYPNFINIAKRNNQNDDIVPLYYEMQTSNPDILNSNSIYKGLESAYTGGNIGMISNDITKIWNDPNPDIECVKFLCMVNNYTIDEAKTLYKLKIPNFIAKRIKKFTKNKVPKFFEYAKDKEKMQVEELNNSTVNRIKGIIGSPKLNFRKAQLGHFDFKMLMSDRDLVYNENNLLHKAIIDDYDSYNKYKKFRISHESYDLTKADNVIYYYNCIRKELVKKHGDIKFVTDVLTYYLYETTKSSFKLTLWSSFGDVLYENLSKNLLNTKIEETNGLNGYTFKSVEDTYTVCKVCGKRILKNSRANSNTKYCEECAEEIVKEQKKEYDLKRIKSNLVICENCGIEFEKTGKRQKYCENCKREVKLKRDRENWNKKHKNSYL